MKLEKKFPQKRVVITGAGSGLGRALAVEFAKMNWNIAIAEIDKHRSQESAEIVIRKGGTPLEVHCDVTKPKDLENAMNTVKKKWGGVDILINNAGVAAAGYFEKIPLDEWDWIIGLNFKSIVHGCRAFIPLFKEQKCGYIVNVASNAGIASMPEMVSYNATKAAAISMSETLKIELSGHNIGVSAVCPTFFKTNLMDQFTSPEQRQRELAERFFKQAEVSSEKVARHVVKSIRKNRFYVITQNDGKNMWRAKRWFPELYFKVFCMVYRTGFFDRHLDTLLKILNAF